MTDVTRTQTDLKSSIVFNARETWAISNVPEEGSVVQSMNSSNCWSYSFNRACQYLEQITELLLIHMQNNIILTSVTELVTITPLNGSNSKSLINTSRQKLYIFALSIADYN